MANEEHSINIVARFVDQASKNFVQLRKNIDEFRRGTKGLTTDTNEAVKANQQLSKAHSDLSRQISVTNSNIQRETKLQQEQNATIRDFNKTQKERDIAAKRLDATNKRLAVSQERLRALTVEQNKINESTISSSNRLGRAFDDLRGKIKDNNRELNNQHGLLNRLSFSWGENSDQAQKLERRLARLGRAMLGLGVAGVIVFMHSLASSITAVAGQAVALAGSLTYAAGILGGTFVSAIAQAIPVLGLLGATMQRLSVVMDAVNQHTLIQKQAAGEAATGLEAQKEASNATAEAQRGLSDAQRDLTDARKAGRLEIEDLIAAEKEAELQAQRSVLAQRDAKFALEDAIQEGDVSGIRSAQLDLKEARQGRSSATTDLQRARQEANRARRGGVQNLDSVRTATRAVDDATRRLAEAHREAGVAAQDQSSAENSLQFFLDQLSPAEKELYKAIVRIQDRFKELFTPVTDIIIRSLTRALGRFTDLITDSRIINGFKNLARGIADAVDSITRLATNERSREFFVDMLGEARRNLGPIVQTIRHLWILFQNIATAAAPALRHLFRDLADLTKEWADNTENLKPLREFFATGLEHLRAWAGLLQAVVRLWGNLMGVSGDSALDTIGAITDKLNQASDALSGDPEAAASFFSETSKGFLSLIDIVESFGEAMIESFDAESVEALANILDTILIPALAQAVTWLGEITKVLSWFIDQDIFGVNIGQALEFGLALKILSGGVGLLLNLFGAMLSPLRVALGAMVTFGRTVRDAWVGAFGAGKLREVLGGFFSTFGNRLKAGGSRLATLFRNIWTRIVGGVQFVANLAVDFVSGLVTNIGTFLRANAGKIREFGRKYIGRALIIGIALALPFLAKDVFDWGKELGEKWSEEFGDIGHSIGEALGEGLRVALNEAIIPVLNFFIDRINDMLNAIDAVLPGEQFDEVGPISPILSQEERETAQKSAQGIRDALTGVNKVQQATIDLTKDDISIKKQQEIAWAAMDQRTRKNQAGIEDISQVSGGAAKQTKLWNRELEDNSEKQKDATDSSKRLDKGLGTVRGSMKNTADASTEMGQSIAEVANGVLKGFGVKPLSFDIPGFKSTVDDTAKAIGKAIPGKQRGGWFGDPSQRKQDDRLIGVAGGEAILTGWQQMAANNAFAASKTIGMSPYGSLGELFQHDKRPHASAPLGGLQRGGLVPGYASGGAVGSPPYGGGGPYGSANAFIPISALAKSKFGLTMTAGRTNHSLMTSTGNISDHSTGLAGDFSNGVLTPEEDAWNALWKNRLPQIVKQLIWRNVDQFNGYPIGGHEDHVHVAIQPQYATDAGAMAKILSRASQGSSIRSLLKGGVGIPGAAAMEIPELKAGKIRGPQGPLYDMLKGMQNTMTKAGNKALAKKIGAAGGAGGFSVPGNVGGSVVRQMGQILLANGFSPAGAAGIIGNAYAESTWNPGAVGTGGGGLFGFTTSPVSLADLQDFAQQRHTNWSSVPLQMEMMLVNPHAGGSGGLVSDPYYNSTEAQLRKATDPASAANIFMTDWERPGIPALDRRISGAQQAFRMLQGMGAGRGKAPPKFDNGGVVPGMLGSPQLIMAHGGETVLPTHKFQEGGRVPISPPDVLQEAFRVPARALLKLAKMEEGRFTGVIESLTELFREGGPFDDITTALESMTTYMANKMVQWQYRVKDGIVSNIRTNIDIADRTLEDLEKTGRSLNKELKLLSASMVNTRRALRDIDRELEKEENKKQRKELQDQRDELRTLVNNIRIKSDELDTAIAENLAQKYEAQNAAFQAVIDRMNQRLGRNDTQLAIQEAQNRLADPNPNDDDVPITGIQEILNARGGLLRRNQRQLERELKEARRGRDREEIRNLKQSLLENKLSQLENTQAIKDLTQVTEEQTEAQLFSFNTTAWQVWRSAVLNGMGGVLPQYQIPSLATGGRVTQTGLVQLHAGEVVTSADGSGETHIHITEPMEVADPVALASRIGWEMNRAKV